MSADIQVGQRALRVAVLEGVEPAVLAPPEQFQDPLRRVPGGQVAVEVLVEVGIAVDRIAAQDESRHRVRSEFDGRQW